MSNSNPIRDGCTSEYSDENQDISSILDGIVDTVIMTDSNMLNPSNMFETDNDLTTCTHIEQYEGLGEDATVFANDSKPSKSKISKNKLSNALNNLRLEKKDTNEQTIMNESVPKDKISIFKENTLSDNRERVKEIPTYRDDSRPSNMRAKERDSERERSDVRGRVYEREGAKPKYQPTNYKTDRPRESSSSSMESFDSDNEQEIRRFRKKQLKKFKRKEREHKKKEKRERKERESDREGMREEYYQKYGFPPPSSNSESNSFSDFSDQNRTKYKKSKSRDPSPNSDGERFRDFKKYKKNYKKYHTRRGQNQHSDDSSSTDTSTSSASSYFPSRQNKNDNNGYRESNWYQSLEGQQIEKLLRVLQAKVEVGGNPQLEAILLNIPRKLKPGGLQPDKLGILKKQYSQFPSILQKDSNLLSFIRNFKDVGKEFSVTYCTYNCLLMQYMDDKLKKTVHDLDINFMEITSREFITSLNSGVVSPPLSPPEYKRLFYQYRFSEIDYNNPTEVILKLSSYLKQTSL